MAMVVEKGADVAPHSYIRSSPLDGANIEIGFLASAQRASSYYKYLLFVPKIRRSVKSKRLRSWPSFVNEVF